LSKQFLIVDGSLILQNSSTGRLPINEKLFVVKG